MGMEEGWNRNYESELVGEWSGLGKRDTEEDWYCYDFRNIPIRDIDDIMRRLVYSVFSAPQNSSPKPSSSNFKHYKDLCPDIML